MTRAQPRAVVPRTARPAGQPTLRQRALALAGAPSLAVTDPADAPAPDSPPAVNIGELWLYGVVGGWWRGFDAESVANALRTLGDVDEVHVRIHSPGGYAEDGIAIGNLFRNHAATFRGVVDGIAASAASVIAIACDELIMCPGSRLMVHDASTFGYGTESSLAAASKSIGDCSRNYAGVYAYRAGGTPEDWRQVMLANNELGTWYTADEAVSAHLADTVGNLVAVGSPPVAPEEDLALEDDDWALAVAHDAQLLEHCVPAAIRAAWAGDATPKPPSARPRSGSTTTQETESAVAFSDEQMTTMRTELGLPETADEATIVAAMSEALAERAEPTSTTTVPPGHVVVPQTRLADLEAGAQAGLAAQQILHDRDREAFLDEHRTKFPATSRADWAAEYDRNPKATRALLEKAGDLVPAAEIGHSVDSDASADVKNDPGYMNWRF